MQFSSQMETERHELRLTSGRARSVFCHVHAAAENDWNGCFYSVKTGFVYSLKRPFRPLLFICMERRNGRLFSERKDAFFPPEAAEGFQPRAKRSGGAKALTEKGTGFPKLSLDCFLPVYYNKGQDMIIYINRICRLNDLPAGGREENI